MTDEIKPFASVDFLTLQAAHDAFQAASPVPGKITPTPEGEEIAPPDFDFEAFTAAGLTLDEATRSHLPALLELARDREDLITAFADLWAEFEYCYINSVAPQLSDLDPGTKAAADRVKLHLNPSPS